MNFVGSAKYWKTYAVGSDIPIMSMSSLSSRLSKRLLIISSDFFCGLFSLFMQLSPVEEYTNLEAVEEDIKFHRYMENAICHYSPWLYAPSMSMDFSTATTAPTVMLWCAAAKRCLSVELLIEAPLVLPLDWLLLPKSLAEKSLSSKWHVRRAPGSASWSPPDPAEWKALLISIEKVSTFREKIFLVNDNTCTYQMSVTYLMGMQRVMNVEPHEGQSLLMLHTAWLLGLPWILLWSHGLTDRSPTRKIHPWKHFKFTKELVIWRYVIYHSFTYVNLCKYIYESTVVIGRAAQSFQYTQPFWTQRGATRCKFRT